MSLSYKKIFLLQTKPADISTAESSIRTQLVQSNFLLYIELGEQKLQSDNHEKRLQSLRKELSGLKSTEWQYDLIEKYIGQL